MSEKQVVPLTYGELMLLTEGHGTTPIYEHIGALAAELATVKAALSLQHDANKRAEAGYVRISKERDHWKAEAVWAAKEFMRERECFFQVSYMGQWEMEIAKDPDYQRAQAVLKEAEDE